MKRSFLKAIAFAVIAMLVFPLAACGGNADDGGGDNNPPDDTPKLSVVQLLDKAQGYFNEANAKISNAAAGIGGQLADTVAPMSFTIKPLADKDDNDKTTPTSGPTLDDLEGYVLVGMMSDLIWRYFGAAEHYTAADFSKSENPEAFADLIGTLKHEGEFAALSRRFKEINALLEENASNATVEETDEQGFTHYYFKTDEGYVVSSPLLRQYIDGDPNLTTEQKNEILARRETLYVSDGISITTSGRWVKEGGKALPEALRYDSGGFNKYVTISVADNKASLEGYAVDGQGGKNVTKRITLIKTATDYYVQMYTQGFEPCGFGSPGFVEGVSEKWYDYFDRMNREDKSEVLPFEPYAAARFNGGGAEGTVKSFRNYSRDAGGHNLSGDANYGIGQYALPASWFTLFDADNIFDDMGAMDGKWLDRHELCLCTFNFQGLPPQAQM
jgi:hypothetical protein